jgi:hypothetical protein
VLAVARAPARAALWPACCTVPGSALQRASVQSRQACAAGSRGEARAVRPSLSPLAWDLPLAWCWRSRPGRCSSLAVASSPAPLARGAARQPGPSAWREQPGRKLAWPARSPQPERRLPPTTRPDTGTISAPAPPRFPSLEALTSLAPIWYQLLRPPQTPLRRLPSNCAPFDPERGISRVRPRRPPPPRQRAALSSPQVRPVSFKLLRARPRAGRPPPGRGQGPVTIRFQKTGSCACARPPGELPPAL